MRKIVNFFVLFFVLGVIAPLFSQQLEIGERMYDIDTLHYAKVGPGSYYSEVKYSTDTRTIRAFLLEVDLSNEYITMESVLGKDSLIGTELTSGMAERKSRESAVYFAGTNADFFITAGDVGRPTHGCAVENQIGAIPNNTPHFAYTENGPVADFMTFSGWYRKVGEENIIINNVNYKFTRATTENPNQLVLYNTLNGNYTKTEEDGIEVLIELAGDSEWSINETFKAKVVKIEEGKGNMYVPANHAVLSGRGTRQEDVRSLQIGDEVEVFTGVRFVNLGGDSKVNAMVGGDRMIVEHGQISNTNWVELHPRTAIGYSQDETKLYFCIVDGRSSLSSGVQTVELGEIIRSAGAYRAVNLDGGGSSALYTKELGIMNKPSDSRERAVGNGIYAINTSPTDNVIAEIKCYEHSIILPRYGFYTPKFYGYNQYETLVNTDLEGVKLSCEEASGEIQGDTFIAFGTESGKITAEYGGIRTTINVEIVADIEPFLRLESVLIDPAHPYYIEVQAMVNGRPSFLATEIFDWEVEDTSVCYYEDGYLIAAHNGETKVRGEFNGIELELNVVVEIPSNEYLSIDLLNDFNQWQITTSSNLVDFNMSSPNCPVDFNYTFDGGRNPYIDLAKEMPLYSIPEAIHITVNPGKATVNNITLGIKGNGLSYTYHKWDELEQQEEQTWILTMEDLLEDSEDRIYYPVYMNALRINLNPTGHPLKEETTIQLKEFFLVYNEMSIGITNPILLSKLRIYPNPVEEGEAKVTLQMDFPQRVRMELYSQAGQLVRVKDLGEHQSGEISLPLGGLTPGYYILNLHIGDQLESVKIIIK